MEREYLFKMCFDNDQFIIFKLTPSFCYHSFSIEKGEFISISTRDILQCYMDMDLDTVANFSYMDMDLDTVVNVLLVNPKSIKLFYELSDDSCFKIPIEPLIPDEDLKDGDVQVWNYIPEDGISITSHNYHQLLGFISLLKGGKI